MKKTILLLAAATTLFAGAQAQPYKQAGGEKNLQLSFAPWGNAPVSLQNGVISFRKFNATGTAAWRLGFSVGSNKSTSVLTQASDSLNYPTSIDNGNYELTTGLNPQADRRSSNFGFSIRPGYEKHFAGTDRLSPYIGAELLFSKTSSKIEDDNITTSNYTAVYTNNPLADDVVVSAPWTILATTEKSGSTTFGLNLIAGFDFYFAKNISLGAELNFGYQTTSYSDLESEYVKDTSPDPTSVTNTGTGITTTTVISSHAVTANPVQKQGSANGFGPGVTGLIKLGWLF